MSTRARIHYHEESHKWKVAGAFLIGTPFVVAGLLFCATVVFIPIGFPLLMLSGYPLYKVEKNYMARRALWMKRDRPMDLYEYEEATPWLTEEDLLRLQSGRIEPDA